MIKIAVQKYMLPAKFGNKNMLCWVFFDNNSLSSQILQFDMWNVTPSDRHNWAALKAEIKE